VKTEKRPTGRFFGTELPFEAQKRPLTDYPRFDNPYGHSAYGSGHYQITCMGQSLELDFEAGTRQLT
jgi:hypothetical protein